MISYAFAQTVTPAAAPTDWTFLIVLVVLAAVVAGALWYNHTHPGTLASDWAALVARVSALEGKVAAAVTPAPAPAPTVPASPAGKNGVAGTFSLSVHVTGVATTDLPLIQAEVNRLYL